MKLSELSEQGRQLKFQVNSMHSAFYARKLDNNL